MKLKQASLVILCFSLILLCGSCKMKSSELTWSEMTLSEEDKLVAEQFKPAKVNQSIADSAEWEVLSADSSNLTIKISAPDIYAVLKELYDDDAWIASQEDLNEALADELLTRLGSGNYQTVENTVTVSYTRLDGKIDIDETFEYLDALYGGMYSFYIDIMGGSEE